MQKINHGFCPYFYVFFFISDFLVRIIPFCQLLLLRPYTLESWLIPSCVGFIEFLITFVGISNDDGEDIIFKVFISIFFMPINICSSSLVLLLLEFCPNYKYACFEIILRFIISFSLFFVYFNNELNNLWYIIFFVSVGIQILSFVAFIICWSLNLIKVEKHREDDTILHLTFFD